MLLLHESACGHETDIPTALRNVRYQGQSGKRVLALSFSGFDPSRFGRRWLVAGEGCEIAGLPS